MQVIRCSNMFRGFNYLPRVQCHRGKAFEQPGTGHVRTQVYSKRKLNRSTVLPPTVSLRGCESQLRGRASDPKTSETRRTPTSRKPQVAAREMLMSNDKWGNWTSPNWNSTQLKLCNLIILSSGREGAPIQF